MHFLLSADLEGLNGVVHSSQTQPQEPNYEKTIKILHDEVNTTIEALFTAGATKVTVADAHWDMRNLQIELLHPRASLISGSPRLLSMMTGIDNSDKPVDATCFIGYHAKIGTAKATLAHTYRAKVFKDIKLNGISVGELGLNAALASWFNVPIAFVSGDNALIKEANDLLGDMPSHCNKIALNKYTAILNPYLDNLVNLSESVKQAYQNKTKWKQFKLTSPFNLEIFFHCPSMADGACLIKDVKRLSDDSIVVTDNNYVTVFNLMLAIGVIGASRINSYF